MVFQIKHMYKISVQVVNFIIFINALSFFSYKILNVLLNKIFLI